MNSTLRRKEKREGPIGHAHEREDEDPNEEESTKSGRCRVGPAKERNHPGESASRQQRVKDSHLSYRLFPTGS